MTTEKTYDLIGAMMDYEMGDLENNEILELFSGLVKSGMAWSLQGSYGRQAMALIESGYIDQDGNILMEVD